MAVGPTDPLERARRQLQDDAEQPQWLDLSDAIMARVRGISWPAAKVLAVDLEGNEERDAQASRTFVSARVLRDGLRRALTTDTVEPREIDVTVAQDRLVRLELELVATYAQDLQQVGHWAYAEAVQVLTELLGGFSDLDPEHDITVVITDLHDQEAR